MGESDQPFVKLSSGEYLIFLPDQSRLDKSARHHDQAAKEGFERCVLEVESRLSTIFFGPKRDHRRALRSCLSMEHALLTRISRAGRYHAFDLDYRFGDIPAVFRNCMDHYRYHYDFNARADFDHQINEFDRIMQNNPLGEMESPHSWLLRENAASVPPILSDYRTQLPDSLGHALSVYVSTHFVPRPKVHWPNDLPIPRLLAS